MLPKVVIPLIAALVIFVATLGLLTQRWAVVVHEKAGELADQHTKQSGQRLSAGLGSLQSETQRLQALLDAERKAKAEVQQQLLKLQHDYSTATAAWAVTQASWKTWTDSYNKWSKTESERLTQFCAISEIGLDYDARFFPKAAELRAKIGGRHYPTFEELYELVVNKPYDAKANIWHEFPNAYNQVPSFVFPFSNLRDFDIENALQKLGRAPALWVEVGSFHGNSAVLQAQMLDKKGFKDTPLVCVDPWTGDLGMLLFRDDWQKKLTPGEISEGRSTSYFQFMNNMKSQIDAGKIGPKHIIPLAVTSTVAARYFLSLGLTPDVVYLDSAHEKDETFTEISLFYSLIAPGGILYGDDFSWDSVATDVKRFAEKLHLELHLQGATWMLQKPH